MLKAQLGLKWHECEIIRENPNSSVVRFVKLIGKDGNQVVVKRKPHQIMEVNYGKKEIRTG
jgi:hypothetical protein